MSDPSSWSKRRRAATTFLSAVLVLAGSLTAAVTSRVTAVAATTTVTVRPTDDAYIDASLPTAVNNGNWVTVDASPLRYGYFKYPVSVPVGSRVTSAVFHCYPNGSSSVGLSLWRSTNNAWTESTLTWNNATRPTFTTPALGSTGAVTSGVDATVNLTSAVTTSGTYTFVSRTTTDTAWGCASTEYWGNRPPVLVLTFDTSSPSPTATPPSGTTVVDAIGDGGPDAAHWNSALAARLVGDRPRLMLWSGDVRNTGTVAEWALYDRNYGALKLLTLPTPGNHDWASSSTGYDAEFATDPYADTVSYCNGVTLPNGWGLFSINTYQRTTCLPKLTAFLATPGTRKVVVTHEPRWSGGSHGANQAQEPIWSAMKGHAFALVSGHDHDSQVIQADGMVQLVNGCAGASYYSVSPSKVTAPASLVYYSTSAADCTYDRLVLGSTSVTVEAVHADGSVDFRKTYAVSAQ